MSGPRKASRLTPPRGRPTGILLRFVAAFLAVGLVPVGIFWFVDFRAELERDREDARSALVQATEGVAASFEGEVLGPLARDLLFLSQSPSLDRYHLSSEAIRLVVLADLQKLFFRIGRAEPNHVSISYFGPDGIERVGLVEGRRVRSERPLGAGDAEGPIERAELELFERLVPAGEAAVRTAPPIRDERGRWLLVAGIRTLEPNLGGFGGAIVIHHDLTSFLSEVERIEYLGVPVASASSPAGAVVVPSRAPGAPVAQGEPTPDVAYRAIGGGAVASVACGYEPDRPILLFSLSVAGEVLWARSRRTTRRFLVVLALAFLSAVFLAVYLSRRMSRPAAGRPRGYAAPRGGVGGPAEIANLAASFNRMVDSLEARSAELARSEARYRTIFETVSVSVWEQDHSGLPADVPLDPAGLAECAERIRIVSANPECRRTLGAASEEEVRGPLARFLVPDSRPMLLGFLDAIAEGRERFEARFPARTLSGDRKRLLLVASLDRSGRALVCAVDVTESEREAQELQLAYHRLRETQAQLVQAGKLAAIGELAAGIAHELSQPLTGILAFAHFLSDRVDPALASKTQVIVSQAERMAGIIRHLLDFARQSGSEVGDVEVAAPIERALQLVRESLRHRSIEVAIEIPPGMPPVRAHAQRLEQVFLNLIANARDALESIEGPRRISIRAAPIDGAVEIRVADNGTGIPPDVRSRIFDPFFTTKDPGRGTGLGLSISHGIVAEFGGSIALEEGEGPGATFRIRLPRGERSVPAEPSACVVERSEPAARPGPASRVLLVDDEEVVRATFERLVEDEPFELVTECGAREAIRRLESEPFHAVLTDLRMPGMSGLELVEWIRRERPSLPVGVMTGQGPQEAEKALAAGARGVLLKPFRELDEAVEFLRGLLDGS